MDFITFLKTINNHHIIGVVGDLGDGKSIVGVASVELLRIYSLITNTPLKVVSNIPLGFPHIFVEYYDDLQNQFNTLFFIDEIHLIADSRNTHSGTNFFTTDITVAVRKTGSKMVWTSQETSQVELRVRNRTTLFLNPVKVNDDPTDLQFKINLVSKHRKFIGDITLNLDPFKNDYSTHYIPQPLIDREKKEKEKNKD